MGYSGAARFTYCRELEGMFREKDGVTRTFDGDRPGVAKGTVEKFGEGREGFLQTR